MHSRDTLYTLYVRVDWQGCNARDMFNKSAVVQALIFFVLLILPGIVYGGVNWHTTSRRTTCVVSCACPLPCVDTQLYPAD